MENMTFEQFVDMLNQKYSVEFSQSMYPGSRRIIVRNYHDDRLDQMSINLASDMVLQMKLNHNVSIWWMVYEQITHEMDRVRQIPLSEEQKNASKSVALYDFVRNFIDTNNITCSEQVWQNDGSIGFMQECCEIMGYCKHE